MDVDKQAVVKLTEGLVDGFNAAQAHLRDVVFIKDTAQSVKFAVASWIASIFFWHVPFGWLLIVGKVVFFKWLLVIDLSFFFPSSSRHCSLCRTRPLRQEPSRGRQTHRRSQQDGHSSGRRSCRKSQGYHQGNPAQSLGRELSE